ncbi:IS110 family transposase [Desertimonas flava]|uniref:IS110 family transposase n=1 Tax=Desertimonas flava TaxID=2064846 RepID=UPI000E343C6F|nr:IS110 family transposase [Desertimonas flava]
MTEHHHHVAGADPHKLSITLAVIDALGRELDVVHATNDAAGIESMITELRTRNVVRVGVEGSAGHGLQFATALVEAGFDVREVPARRTAQRRRQRRRPKTDREDALAIARATAADDALGPARAACRNDVVDELAVVHAWRADLVQRRKIALNQAEAVLAKLPIDTLDKIGRRGTTLRRLKRAATHHDDTHPVTRTRLARLAELLDDYNDLTRRIKQLDIDIGRLVTKTGTTLCDEVGISFTNAAGLLIEIGDPFRFRDEAAFARWCGVAAVAVSSGEGASQPVRHRLDLGGNRRVNSMIHTMSVTQARFHPEARDYLTRKRSEGKTAKEARRAHKRRLADRIIRRMWNDTRQQAQPIAA